MKQNNRVPAKDCEARFCGKRSGNEENGRVDERQAVQSQSLPRRGFEVLEEVISEDNVELMSQLIALQECKCMIRFIGDKALKIRSDLYRDIRHHNEVGYVVSDSYDLAQEVALILWQNVGRHLYDTHHIDKKGKAISIEVCAERAVERIICCKLRRARTDICLEALTRKTEPREDFKTEEEQDYTVFDQIVAKLNLTENMRIALECRMAGMSFPQIAKILERCTSTVFEYFTKMQQRYMAIYG